MSAARCFCGSRAIAARSSAARSARISESSARTAAPSTTSEVSSALVPGESFLQGRFGRLLERGVEGGPHRVRLRGDALDSGERPRVAADMIDEMEAARPLLAIDGGEGRKGLDRLLHLIARDGSIVL